MLSHLQTFLTSLWIRIENHRLSFSTLPCGLTSLGHKRTMLCSVTIAGQLPSKEPKFYDVCVLFKHSNLCSRMLEMHSERPRFQNFSKGHFLDPLVTFGICKSHLLHKFFLLYLLHSFCHPLKTLLKTT